MEKKRSFTDALLCNDAPPEEEEEEEEEQATTPGPKRPKRFVRVATSNITMIDQPR
jgi:hypothetical protein